MACDRCCDRLSQSCNVEPVAISVIDGNVGTMNHYDKAYTADEHSLMRCEACGKFVKGTTKAGEHENRYHDGAQMCWTAAQRAQAEDFKQRGTDA